MFTRGCPWHLSPTSTRCCGSCLLPCLLSWLCCFAAGAAVGWLSTLGAQRSTRKRPFACKDRFKGHNPTGLPAGSRCGVSWEDVVSMTTRNLVQTRARLAPGGMASTVRHSVAHHALPLHSLLVQLPTGSATRASTSLESKSAPLRSASVVLRSPLRVLTLTSAAHESPPAGPNFTPPATRRTLAVRS
jgi:hypothetical protein